MTKRLQNNQQGIGYSAGANFMIRISTVIFWHCCFDVNKV